MNKIDKTMGTIFEKEVKSELKKMGLDRRNKIADSTYRKAINNAHKNLTSALGK
jgi:hypothetical protein